MELPGECSVERECPPVAGLAVLVPLGRAVATAHWHGTWVYRMLYLKYHVACSCIVARLWTFCAVCLWPETARGRARRGTKTYDLTHSILHSIVSSLSSLPLSAFSF